MKNIIKSISCVESGKKQPAAYIRPFYLPLQQEQLPLQPAQLPQLFPREFHTARSLRQ